MAFPETKRNTDIEFDKQFDVDVCNVKHEQFCKFIYLSFDSRWEHKAQGALDIPLEGYP